MHLGCKNGQRPEVPAFKPKHYNGGMKEASREIMDLRNVTGTHQQSQLTELTGQPRPMDAWVLMP